MTPEMWTLLVSNIPNFAGLVALAMVLYVLLNRMINILQAQMDFQQELLDECLGRGYASSQDKSSSLN